MPNSMRCFVVHALGIMIMQVLLLFRDSFSDVERGSKRVTLRPRGECVDIFVQCDSPMLSGVLVRFRNLRRLTLIHIYSAVDRHTDAQRYSYNDTNQDQGEGDLDKQPVPF